MYTNARKTWGFLLLLAIVLFAGERTAFAQVQSGRIVGNVTDPQHASVAGATVKVTNTATNITLTVQTDTDGNYVVTPLDPGTYSVTMTSPGFDTEVKSGVELAVGQSVAEDAELKIGSTVTEVKVVAGTPELSTESGALGTTVTNHEIVDLPLNGRDYTKLAALSPGDVNLPATGNTQNVRPENVNGNVVNGVSGQMTVFLLDGANITEQHEGGTYIQTSIDALGEFNVETNPYSAEYSGPGGTLNATTKSGTNQYHGDLFEFFRNEKLDARNYFALPQNKEELKRNQFGGVIGGPLGLPHLYNGKDKTFFFLGYEGGRQIEGQVSNNVVPSPAERSGNFTQPGDFKIYDPLTTVAGGARTQFSYNGTPNVIPPNRIDQTAKYFMQLIPAYNSTSVSNGVTTYRYISVPNNVYDVDKVVVRLDQQIKSNHRVSLRYSTDRNRETDFASFPTLGSTYLQGPATNYEGILTSTFGPRIVNTVLFSRLEGQYRSTAYFQGQGVAMDTAAGIDPSFLAGLVTPAYSSFPTFSLTGYAGFQGQAGDGRPKTQNRAAYEIHDNVTWIKGKHILKFGLEIYHRSALLTDTRTGDGSFNYSGVMTQNNPTGGTGNGFADFLLGWPASSSRSYMVPPGSYWGGIGTYDHVFAQDDWKVTNRLTLNIGLRYEYNPWLTPYKGQGAGFNPALAQPIIVSSSTDTVNVNAQPDGALGYSLYQQYIQTSHQAGAPLAITKNDNYQFGPRFGLAWRPFGDKTVIRGGWGLYYEPESTNVRLNFNFLPFNLVESLTATTKVVPTQPTSNFFLGQPLGAGLNPANSPVSWSPLPLSADNARVTNYSFGIQQQAFGMLLEADYVGTKGNDLAGGLSTNIPNAGPGNIQARRPYPIYGVISYNTQNSRTLYNSLQVKIQKHYSAGLWYQLAYTMSKASVYGQTLAYGGPTSFRWTKSGGDIPEAITFSVGYALPFGKGKRFLGNMNGLGGALLDGVIGGWQVSGLTTFRSGMPFTPSINTDELNNGIGGQHPNQILPGCGGTHSLTNYFDKTHFVDPAQYTYGTAGTNICRSGLYSNSDVSLSKVFSIREYGKLQFRAEAFNLPNSAYFAGPSTATDSSTNPTVSGTSNTPRQIQFALKYEF
ncbi:MAG TPA: carboxypeptidase-like regulatory domain-containing protein [Candidatus Acidoferrum sp.]|jgi:hypothetical protein|nr:carboxypeptidase-like regulatory domain-containing protein [Candidatus Acidoferrum sp.]